MAGAGRRLLTKDVFECGGFVTGAHTFVHQADHHGQHGRHAHSGKHIARIPHIGQEVALEEEEVLGEPAGLPAVGSDGLLVVTRRRRTPAWFRTGREEKPSRARRAMVSSRST